MKTKKLFVTGVIVGAFTLGAMFAPLGESTAESIQASPASQKAVNGNDNVQQTNVDYICPITGEPTIGKGAGYGKNAGMGMGMGRGAAGGGQAFAGSMHEVIAEELGMTAEDLYAARSEGKSIADLAAEKGIEVEELLNVIVEEHKAKLQPLIETGQISEGQMEAMLTNHEARMEAMMNQDEIGPRNGRGAGHMGMSQGGRMHRNAGSF
ncbi:hypothetical protein [Bacillus sp. B15-48]|uniref:hypothetical protein n=1 Tax=Bacillus sp. B15-48 TaxID=1548601 RepID=UPI00193F3C0B|nr:hypothetical protein [Bacillus sp. B15-48]MBM4763233.1 hypothetical protein [Bacillus sp. B15-48]